MKTVIAFLFVILIAGGALATPPINGTYKSVTLGGTMLDGHYSESWTAPDGELGLTNTTNAQSWDGGTLGTQWWMYCAQIVSTTKLSDTVDGSGNGSQTWLVVYAGGSMVLDGAGPWGDASEASYTATFDSYAEIKQYEFESFAIVSAIANVSIQATFQGYDNTCMDVIVSNQERFSTTDTEVPLASYPVFLDPNTCAGTRVLGSWGESDDFTMVITGCVIPTQTTSWGKVKSLYQE